jgi:hypothetical protein
MSDREDQQVEIQEEEQGEQGKIRSPPHSLELVEFDKVQTLTLPSVFIDSHGSSFGEILFCFSAAYTNDLIRFSRDLIA